MASLIRNGLQGAWRIAQTAKILGGTGLNWLLGDRPPAPRLLRRTFERLGATYIKLGQFVASSPSFFPADYVQELQYCLDQTDPLPFKTMQKVLREELGRSLPKLFAEIDPEPLASASIAQVHAARLRSGEDVVIKIQKPGVQNVLLTDLNFLYASARILEFLKPNLSWASLSAIVEEIQKTMMEECDFLKEADNLRTFGRFLANSGNDQVVVPQVYEQATTLRVLTMERLYGAPFTDLETIRRLTRNTDGALIAAMNTWFASLLYCEFFHADVHAGNLMVLDDGRIGFIDFGIVGRISPDTWAAMASLMEAIPAADYQRIAEAMMRIGITKETVDVGALSRDLEALIDSLDDFASEDDLNSLGKNNPINRFLLDMVAVGERHGLHFPREFALLLKQFLYFDRYVQILAPDLDIYGDDRLHILPEDA
ncbi:MAG: AarF/ABC1/UbiB kinase family protein [Gammaproteobacteria bacterium]|nr:AarF/ABC1/UbiB kinase family protein [Gammaproteobacteria bacterium]